MLRSTVSRSSGILVLLAHGAGAGMNHHFMVNLEQHLLQSGLSTLLFQFPFMEAGKRRTDNLETAIWTWSAVIRHAAENWPEQIIIASGKSWGGRMLSHWAVQCDQPDAVKGLIFFGFPLHPAKRPEVKRAEHMGEINLPMLFLQGTRDLLASSSLIRSVVSPLGNATLRFFEGADHAFVSGKKDFTGALAASAAEWSENLVRFRP